MRNAGWTLTVLLVFGSVANAQPVLPIAPTSSETAQKLKKHLDAWGKAMEKVENNRVDLSLKRVDGTFKKVKEYSGVLVFKKPDLLIARLDYAGDPSKKDYQAAICDGKSMFIYNGIEKSIVEYQITKPSAEADDPALARLIKENSNNPAFMRLARSLLGFPHNILMWVKFLSGTDLKGIRERFDISLGKENADFIYLDLKPRSETDKLEYAKVQIILCGTNSNTPYILSKVVIEHSNEDAETWEFSNHEFNLPGIKKEMFSQVKVPGFSLRTAPTTKELQKLLEQKPEK